MWSIGFDESKPEKPLDAMGLLEKAAQLGVSVVQFGPNLPLLSLPDRELERLINQARDKNINLELATRGLETESILSQIALAKRLGSPFLRTVPEIGGRVADTRFIPDSIHTILPILESEGINLALENGSIPAWELRKILDGFSNPRLGIVLDTANSFAVPEGWQYVTEVLAPYTMCLHLKDFIVQRFWHMMGFKCEGRPAGQGQLDIPWLLEAVGVSRFKYNVILELWPPEQETMLQTIKLEQDWVVESIQYLRKFIMN
jgi:sugar phosphate isomerase/epimerase